MVAESLREAQISGSDRTVVWDGSAVRAPCSHIDSCRSLNVRCIKAPKHVICTECA
jgi:hypothetical protein